MKKFDLEYIVNLCKNSYKNNLDFKEKSSFSLKTNKKIEKKKNIIIDTKYGLQCNISLEKLEKKIYIIFRGTDELKDWNTNLYLNNIHLKENIKIHKGFYLLLQKDNIIKNIIYTIDNLMKFNNDFEIIICGHSLGGALSQILGYELLDKKYKITIFSFGMPSIGNERFEEKVLSKYKVYTINIINDIVYNFFLKIYENKKFTNIILQNENNYNIIKSHYINSYVIYLKKKFDI